MDFTDKRVWITGASSGIGAALAEAHTVVPLDLADPPSLEDAARAVQSDHGPPDVLVNNGGISQFAPAADTPLEVDRRIMEVNYFGAVALTKAVLPAMQQRGSGHVVVTSSLLGKISIPTRSAYAASKHALHGFFDALRAEVYDSGVRVTLACPGYVDTRVSANALTASGEARGVMDAVHAGGMAPGDCARRIADAVQRERPEVLLGPPQKYAVWLRRFLPSRLFHAVTHRIGTPADFERAPRDGAADEAPSS
jgi:short-subunit dehydrogenase